MRLHPLSAVNEAAGLAASGAVAGLVLAGLVPALGLPVAASVLGPLLGGAAGVAAAVARYLAFDYEITPERLVVRSGVLRRRQREIPLGRVQSVDVSQPVLARLFGLAAVSVETAGGGTTEAELAFVTADEAGRLRDVLRERSGEEAADRAGGAPGEPSRGVGAERAPGAAGSHGAADAAAAAAAPGGRGEELFRLSNRDLAVLGVVSFRWRVVPVALLGAPVFGSLVPDLPFDALALFEWWVLAALAATVLGLAGVVGLLVVTALASALATVVRYYGFALRRVGDELRYERGLLARYAGTIPLDKVQTLTVEENVAMRRLGYAALTVETAGYAGGDGDRAPSAVPLAAREEVLALVESLTGVDDLAVEGPPERARRRYVVRYVLVVLGVAGLLLAARLAFGAPRAWFVPLAILPLAPVAGRLKWRHRGYRVDEDHLLTRDGYWRRATRIVPHYRLQTVVLRRTVFQRRWGLASVTADTASAAGLLGGDATIHDRDDDDARALHRALREHLQAALRRRRAGRGPRIGRVGGSGARDGSNGDGSGDGAAARRGDDDQHDDVPSGR